MTAPVPDFPALQRPLVRRLALSGFRSYSGLDLEIERRLVVLTGPNGAGKTNVLEALSFLSLGRGLRRADLKDCLRREAQNIVPSWAVSAELASDDMQVQLGTGYESGETSRRCRVNRAPVGSATAFAEYVSLIWQTPAMDGLFTGPASERRRFLDRLVLAMDAAHGSRVNALERALRNRNRLLEESFTDKIWLDAAEREVAELGIAVATARFEAISRLQALILRERDEFTVFPWAELALEGEIDRICRENPAVVAEETYRALLHDNRSRDAAAGRTLIGPHVSDLHVRHGPKAMDGAQSSTGEQKALLTGLILAHAQLIGQMTGRAPLILLDEIAAHFDPERREALFNKLDGFGAQIWMTGADPAAFAGLEGKAHIFHIEQGRVHPT